jgi:hypothetical protein
MFNGCLPITFRSNMMGRDRNGKNIKTQQFEREREREREMQGLAFKGCNTPNTQ